MDIIGVGTRSPPILDPRLGVWAYEHTGLHPVCARPTGQAAIIVASACTQITPKANATVLVSSDRSTNLQSAPRSLEVRGLGPFPGDTAANVSMAVRSDPCQRGASVGGTQSVTQRPRRSSSHGGSSIGGSGRGATPRCFEQALEGGRIVSPAPRVPHHDFEECGSLGPGLEGTEGGSLGQLDVGAEPGIAGHRRGSRPRGP